MRSQSAKLKGRRLHQKIVADLYETFPGLGDGDIRSTSMGAGGEDILLSAAARKLIPFSFEAKNQERVNIWEAYTQCKANCGKHAPAVVIKKNNSENTEWFWKEKKSGIHDNIWDRSSIKYVIKEVGVWGQKMAIFDDLQYYLC